MQPIMCCSSWAGVEAVIVFLPKQGHLCTLQNWYPILLLSADLKITVKALSVT